MIKDHQLDYDVHVLNHVRQLYNKVCSRLSKSNNKQ